MTLKPYSSGVRKGGGEEGKGTEGKRDSSPQSSKSCLTKKIKKDKFGVEYFAIMVQMPLTKTLPEKTNC